MVTDNKLKKEFSTKDVQRLRNLFSGKFGESTTVQVGYTRKEVDRKEGDVWEEDKKQWTIKDGVKQTYTKLDGIKKLFNTPMICPECSIRMRGKHDKKMYQLFGKCFNCVQSYETKLKMEGKYEEYANKIMYSNAATFIEEAKGYIEQISNEKHAYYTENGKEEDWSGPDVNQSIIAKMKEELVELEERIAK